MTEQSCCNCEWLVTVGNDKACNAFAVPTNDVTDANLCGEWEVRDVVALQERNKATAQKITQSATNSLPVRLTDDRERPILQDFTYHPYYMPTLICPEELQQRQQILNQVHQVIDKIEVQRGYIIRRFNVEPTQVLIDVNTLREIAQCRETRHNISYISSSRKKYFRDLEIIECHSRSDEEIAEVLFINLLL